MRDEKDILDDIFDKGKLWNGIYEVGYCRSCECVIITCPKCKNTTCNCGGCEYCNEDFKDFVKNSKHSEWSYLSKKEKVIAHKIRFLKEYTLKCIKQGYYEINWKYLKDSGYLCKTAEDIFYKEIQAEIDNANLYNNLYE